MSQYTAEQIKTLTKVESWVLRTCSMCDAPLVYIFDGDRVGFDSNCDCVSYWTPVQERSWQDVADTINRQTDDVQAKILAELAKEPRP